MFLFFLYLSDGRVTKYCPTCPLSPAFQPFYPRRSTMSTFRAVRLFLAITQESRFFRRPGWSCFFFLNNGQSVFTISKLTDIHFFLLMADLYVSHIGCEHSKNNRIVTRMANSFFPSFFFLWDGTKKSKGGNQFGWRADGWAVTSHSCPSSLFFFVGSGSLFDCKAPFLASLS